MSSFNLLESTSDYFIEDPAVNRTVSPTEGREPASRKRRKETNPKWELEFTKRYCNDDVEEASRIISQFFEFNESQTTKPQADALLQELIMRGAKEDMLRAVFRIGNSRYVRIRDNREPQKGGGKNSNATTEDMIEQLNRFVQTGIPTLSSYSSSCPHKKIKMYITDAKVTSWRALFDDYYIPFEANTTIRKMGFITFYKNMELYHPELCLNQGPDREQGSPCEICLQLHEGMKDPNLQAADQQNI